MDGVPSCPAAHRFAFLQFKKVCVFPVSGKNCITISASLDIFGALQSKNPKK
jgi:hypothetical protein